MSDLQWQLADESLKDAIFAHYRACAAHVASHTGWDEYYPGMDEVESDLRDRGLLVALTPEGAVAATMTVLDGLVHADEPFFTPRKKPAYLCRFGLSPALQGRGLGRKMMQATLDWCRAKGYDGVRFYAERENPVTLHLYDSMGFTRFPDRAFSEEEWTGIPYEMLF